MDTQHIYSRPKRNFGIDINTAKFSLFETKDVFNDPPDLEKYKANFEELKFVSRGVQNVPDMSEHLFNTVSVAMQAHEVQNKAATEEPEQVARLRKKAEREQNYIKAVENQSKSITPSLQINNAQDCTTQYFSQTQMQEQQPPAMHVLAMFKDPEIVRRPVTQVVFQPEVNRAPVKFVVAYGRAFPTGELEKMNLQSTSNAYIFDVSNSSQPEFTLFSQVQINAIQYSQKDAHVLYAGLESGVAAMYDTRKSGHPISVSDIQYSHKSPITDLKILKSKSASEFVTVGTDGQILFWDCRSMQKPLENEVYSVDFNSDKTLQFPLQSLNCEMKILAGSSSGHIFNIDKKSKTIYTILGHSGAVRTIQRNPFHQKYFATCGDYSVKYYIDEQSTKTPIMSFFADQRYVDLRLSCSRPGVFVGCRLNGGLDVYDLFRNAGEPVLSTQLFSTSECTCMDFDVTGKYVLTGTNDGLISLASLSQGLVLNQSLSQDKYERGWIQNLFERETKRAKLLEARGKGKPPAAAAAADAIENEPLEKTVKDLYEQLMDQ